MTQWWRCQKAVGRNYYQSKELETPNSLIKGNNKPCPGPQHTTTWLDVLAEVYRYTESVPLKKFAIAYTFRIEKQMTWEW